MLVLVIWVFSFVIVGVVFLNYTDVAFNATKAKAAAYYPILKLSWSLFLWWISFACINGDAGFICSFLSTPFFQVISKITYSTYLVHLFLIAVQIKRTRSLVYFTDYEMVKQRHLQAPEKIRQKIVADTQGPF